MYGTPFQWVYGRMKTIDLSSDGHFQEICLYDSCRNFILRLCFNIEKHGCLETRRNQLRSQFEMIEVQVGLMCFCRGFFNSKSEQFHKYVGLVPD